LCSADVSMWLVERLHRRVWSDTMWLLTRGRLWRTCSRADLIFAPSLLGPETWLRSRTSSTRSSPNLPGNECKLDQSAIVLEENKSKY
jgi:hypothetical protein